MQDYNVSFNSCHRALKVFNNTRFGTLNRSLQLGMNLEEQYRIEDDD